MISGNILLTGGAGFIGSHILKHLLKKYPKCNIFNLDKLTYAGNLTTIEDINDDSNYKFIKGDICDKELINKIFRNNDIDIVLNIAAETHVDTSIDMPFLFANTNIIGTITLLESAKNEWLKSDLSNKKFIQISTDEVYGSLGKQGFFTEATAFAPNSPYSASKASADHWVKAYYSTYNLPVIISHCSNNYGPYQYPEKLIPLTIQRILNKRIMQVYGDGANIRDWIYIDDHVKAIDTILEYGVVGETYNIGGDQEINNLELVKKIISIVNKKMGNKGDTMSSIKYVEDRKGHDFRYAIDTTKIEQELNWKPNILLEEGLEKTIDWYLSNQDWVLNISGNHK